MKKITLQTGITLIALLIVLALFSLLPTQKLENKQPHIEQYKKANPYPQTHGRKTVGLALGSGGARGLAHIGVIKALEKHHIPIDYIAGASSGALVGGLYAATRNSDYLESVATATNWRELLSLIDLRFRTGLIEGEKLTLFIESHIGDTAFSELAIPLTVIATNLHTGESVRLHEGKVSDAIRASVSLPFIFKPIERNSVLLLDGGLTEPVPVAAVRAMGADVVIAVNLDAQNVLNGLDEANPSAFTTTVRALDILRYQLAQENVTEADIVLIPETGDVLWHEFVDDGSIIEAGKKEVEKHIHEIRRQLQ
ncbi:patatin-like phospholipase family protein [Candidatus Kaiserbacteria bacterium]|nr:MAG: patatin-like phospholipase family protein [Candidatus Kaiserbacteria bacterium]